MLIRLSKINICVISVHCSELRMLERPKLHLNNLKSLHFTILLEITFKFSWGWLAFTCRAASRELNVVFVFLWLIVVCLLRFRRGSKGWQGDVGSD